MLRALVSGFPRPDPPGLLPPPVCLLTVAVRPAILNHMVYHQTRLDATFAALAHSVRREILARLATGEKTVGELAARFDMSLPAASKHVHVLERAGLARIRRDGRVRRTTLVAAPMREAASWIERYQVFWETQLDQLADYLERTTSEEDTSWQARSGNPRRRTSSSKSAAPSRPRATGSSTPGRGRTSSGSGSRRAR
jgi:DNA-binding transcriptional ArsR family regulator